MTHRDFQIELQDKVLVATIDSTQVTHVQIQELCDELTEQIRFENTSLFVLDMSEVTFLASACLGVLVTFVQDLEPVRGRLALGGCQSNVEFLFKVTRLDAVIALYEDVETACEAIRVGGQDLSAA